MSPSSLRSASNGRSRDPLSPSRRGAFPSPRLTLLVCADDALRARLVEALSEQLDVETAADAPRALACARTRPPRLVIACEEAGGLDLLASLRADLRMAHLPVLCLTDDAPERQVRALRQGADGALPRSSPPSLLLALAERTIQVRDELRERWSRRAALVPTWEAGDSAEAVFLDHVREAAEAGLAIPEFAVGDLAHALFLGRRQLTRRLKDLTGETPGALIRRLRMGRASALLAEGWGAGEVAAAVGFRSASQFRQAFREAYGVPPSSVDERTGSGQDATAPS